jgi:hypothetical protein
MREKQEDWESHLKVIIEEICGLSEIYNNNLDFLPFIDLFVIGLLVFLIFITIILSF